jgi:hypothetical protein
MSSFIHFDNNNFGLALFANFKLKLKDFDFGLFEFEFEFNLEIAETDQILFFPSLKH